MGNDLKYYMDIAQIKYDDVILEKFEKYKNLLQSWNEKINITSITEDEEIYLKHFIDSILILNYDIIKNADKIIDIGTGGGFPGIPIKIIMENTKITLLDSLNKRIEFLKEVIMSLHLDKIEAVHERAEILAKDYRYRGKYDVAVSRAVASLNVLCEYCLPFVRKGGIFIAYKSGETEEELKNSQKAIKILGGKIIDDIKFVLPGSEQKRSIIVIKKVSDTPQKYPRKAGLPSKKPL